MNKSILLYNTHRYLQKMYKAEKKLSVKCHLF